MAPSLLAAAAPFAVYLLTGARHVADGDAAIFATRAFRLGLAHPPGYALMGLLGKLVTTCVPFGPLAWRANLVAALAAAAAAALGCALLRRWAVGRVPAVLAMWLLALSPLFWSQALYINAYVVSVACTLGIVLLLDVWAERRRLPLLAAAAGLHGLALGGHPTIALYAPAVAFYVLWQVRGDGWRRVLATCGVGIGAGLAGCVPWVAYTLHCLAPDANGGLAQRFWGYLTASGTHSDWRLFFTGVASPGYARELVLHVLRTLLELSPVGVALAAAGAVALARRRPMALALIGVGYLMQANMAATLPHRHFFDVYRLPCHTLLALPMGVGLGLLWARARAAGWRLALCAGAAALVLGPAHAATAVAPRGEGRLAHLWASVRPKGPVRARFARLGHEDALAALREARPGSTIVANWGPFATLYFLQQVEGRGCDVALTAGFDKGEKLERLLAERGPGARVYAYFRGDELRALDALAEAFDLREVAAGSMHAMFEVLPRCSGP